MKLSLHQSLRLEQRLVQSPQMIQAMQILQLPTVELRERIDRELQENPFLEVEEGAGDRPEARPTEDGARADLVRRMERFLEESPHPAANRARRTDGEPDLKYEALLNAPDPRATLADRFLEELHLLELGPRERTIGEYLIQSLDERGYLPVTPEEVATGLADELPDVTLEEIEKVLGILRRIGPPGIAARDLRECLLLQIDRSPQPNGLVRTLIENHLADLAKNRFPKIVRETGRSLEEVKAASEVLRALRPAPGADLGGQTAAVIVPDVVVERIEDDYLVRLERGDLPRLRLSADFRRMVEQAKEDRAAYELLKRKLESAKWLIDAIAQRDSTLQRIAVEIVRRQPAFLEEGPSRLLPMRMQEVADAVGVHISTVSRAIKGKYVQVPRGIVDMRSFFTGGTETETGEVESQTAIKEKVRTLVEGEDRQRPLSDEEISSRLREEGIGIARRTVTKYRKALGIPPSSARRAY